MINKISNELALKIHELIAKETGGSIGVKDDGLLDSALNNAFQTFSGFELYPTIEEKATALGFSLISDHAFIDGNKRIGMLIMLVFLKINDIHLNLKDEDVINAGLGVADGTMDHNALLSWIKEHKIN